MKTAENSARLELAEVCRLAYTRGYISGTEGNFSIRLSENLILTTPRGTCKGKIEAAELVLTDLKGEPIDSNDSRKPSTELKMHLIAYQIRDDIKAVAHAHPTVAVGFTVAGKSLSPCILPEVVCTLGKIPVAPYATPSTDEVPDSIEHLISDHDAIMLDHHGVLTLGTNIWDAFYKLETVEHHAQTMLVAEILGGAKPLLSSQVGKLIDILDVYGVRTPVHIKELTGPEFSRPDAQKKL